MKKYFIHYYAKTLLAIDDRKTQQKSSAVWKFNFGDISIFVKDYLKQENVNRLHMGLEFFVSIEDVNKKEAEKKSKNFIETIINLITFSALTSCQSAKMIDIIEIKKDASLFPFQYYIYPFENDLILSSLVQIDKNCFNEIWSGYDKSQYQQRIIRAMSWFRKGLSEKGTDEFISYWIGIELLGCILKKETGNEFWDGIKKVFQDKLNYENFNEVKEIRNEILHGYKELSINFVKKVEKYTPILRKGLIACISECLNIPDKIFTEIVNKKIRKVKIQPWLVMFGNIENIPYNLNELIKNYPQIKVEIKDKNIIIDSNGKLKFNCKFEHNFFCHQNAKFKIDRIENWGDKHAGIENVQMDIKDK